VASAETSLTLESRFLPSQPHCADCDGLLMTSGNRVVEHVPAPGLALSLCPCAVHRDLEIYRAAFDVQPVMMVTSGRS
jgi:hypothetical protein